MKWHSRIRLPAGGQQKGQLTHKNKKELMHMCSRMEQIIAPLVSNDDSLAVIETCLCHLVGGFDTQTRNSLFKVVNMVTDAQHEAAQQSLVTEKMLIALEGGQRDINAGLVAKNLVDALLINIKKNELKPVVKDDIFKSVIVRLSMELSHDEIDQLIHHLLPKMKTEEERVNNKGMYG